MNTDTRLIPLTQGQFAIVSPEDYDWAIQFRWYTLKKKTSYGFRMYAMRSGPRPVKETILLHREIAKRAMLPASERYDHIDGNGLNDVRQNIRPCTATQNQCNRAKASGTTSRFKGVYWDTNYGFWCASICVSKKRVFIGFFTSEEQAAAAYNYAAKLYHGEFARLNDVRAEVLSEIGPQCEGILRKFLDWEKSRQLIDNPVERSISESC